MEQRLDRRIDELRAHMDQWFVELRAHTDQRFAVMDGRMNPPSWMIGSFGAVLLALVAAVLAKLFVS